MTILFGRLRLSITLTRTTAPRHVWEATVPVGLNDHALARLPRRAAIDVAEGRWDALAIFHGGMRRP